MSEALARVRNDSILVRPEKAPRAGRGIVWRLVARACALPPRVYLGAALSALLAGISVNGLLLRRTAPLTLRRRLSRLRLCRQRSPRREQTRLSARRIRSATFCAGSLAATIPA